MQKSNKLIPVLTGVILTIAALVAVLIILNGGEDSTANESTAQVNTPTSEPIQSSSTVTPDLDEPVNSNSGADYDQAMLDIYQTRVSTIDPFRTPEKGMYCGSVQFTRDRRDDAKLAYADIRTKYGLVDITEDNTHLSDDTDWAIAQDYLRLSEADLLAIESDRPLTDPYWTDCD